MPTSMDEQKKHDEERQSLLTKVESLTKDNDKKTTQIANLRPRSSRMKDDYGQGEGPAHARSSASCTTRPSGSTRSSITPTAISRSSITMRGEVQLNINRSMGARPQMVMSVFDSRSPGIPTEKPKGTIELIKVGDRFSIARIVKTMNPIDPIHDGRHRLFRRLVAQQSRRGSPSSARSTSTATAATTARSSSG